MKEIILYNWDTTLVDDEDYEMLNQYRWSLNTKGYPQTNIKINNKNTTKRIHQFLINTPKNMETDHIDGNKLNNQKNNLRIISRSQNQMNSKRRCGCSSKYKGVCWHKNSKKWFSYINIDKKRINIGYFNSEIEAAKTYNKKAIELFGNFAYINEV